MSNTTINHSTAYKTWKSRLENAHIEPLTHAQIRQFCNNVVGLAVLEEARGYETTITANEARELVELTETLIARWDGLFLTRPHNDKALVWVFAHHGELADRVNFPDDYFNPEQIVGGDSFRWTGWKVLSPWEYGRESVIPVWGVRYHRPDGDVSMWHYCWTPWQKERYGA